MTNQQLYLITGVFFQETRTFGTAIDKQIGIRATVQDVINYTLFSGILNTYDDDGQLQDGYGTSKLIITKVSDDSFVFIKKYDRQGHSFTYHFFRKGIGEYVGYWENKKMKMRGLARCFIKGINPEEFFQYKGLPEELEKFTSEHLKKFTEKEKVSENDNLSTQNNSGNDDLPF